MIRLKQCLGVCSASPNRLNMRQGIPGTETAARMRVVVFTMALLPSVQGGDAQAPDCPPSGCPTDTSDDIEFMQQRLTPRYTNASNVTVLQPIPNGTGIGDNASRAKAALDCQVSDWTDWADCVHTKHSGFKGAWQTRSRTIVTPQSGNGTACPRLIEEAFCEHHPWPHPGEVWDGH
mmetsp:Transcript_81671/g.142396  ORF Transcript_81671/g.142396 Transcript_81671/m.142396 type:complete len:177 (-) Transcript_81671:36-566(-)